MDDAAAVAMVPAWAYMRHAPTETDPHYMAVEVFVPPSVERRMGVIICESGIALADAPRTDGKSAFCVHTTVPANYANRAMSHAALWERLSAIYRVLMAEILGPNDPVGLSAHKRQFWLSAAGAATKTTPTTAFTATRIVDGVDRPVARCYRLVGNRRLVVMLDDGATYECEDQQAASMCIDDHLAGAADADEDDEDDDITDTSNVSDDQSLVSA